MEVCRPTLWTSTPQRKMMGHTGHQSDHLEKLRKAYVLCHCKHILPKTLILWNDIRHYTIQLAGNSFATLRREGSQVPQSPRRQPAMRLAHSRIKILKFKYTAAEPLNK